MTDDSSKSLMFIGFICAILSTLAWIIYVFSSTSFAPPAPVTDASVRLLDYQGSLGIIRSYGWAGVFGGFLSIPYMLSIVYGMQGAGPQRWLAFVAGVIGAFLTAMAFMGTALSAVYFLIPLAEGSPELLQSTMVAIEATLKNQEAAWFFGSFLAYSFAIVWIAYDALRTGNGPAWLNWIGIIGGVSGIVWLRPFLDFLNPVAILGTIGNITLLSVWAIGLTFVMWRNADHA